MSGVEPIQAQREKKADEVVLERQAEIDELLWLMSDPRGRRFMWRRLSETGLYRSSFVPGGEFATTAFLEGQRALGLKQLDQIMQFCPDRFQEMQKEARRNERRSTSK